MLGHYKQGQFGLGCQAFSFIQQHTGNLDETNNKPCPVTGETL